MLLGSLLALTTGCDPEGGFVVARFLEAGCTTDGLDLTSVSAKFQYENIAADRAGAFEVRVSFHQAPLDTERTGPLLCSDTLEVSGMAPGAQDIGTFECSGPGTECPTTYVYDISGVSSSVGSGALEY